MFHWQCTIRQPPPRLKGLVCPYISHSQTLGQPVRLLQTPSPNIFIIIGLGEACSLTGQVISERLQSFLVDVKTFPLITEHSGRQCFILIPLPPWSGYQILGGRLLDLTEQVIPLNDIWGRKVDFLTEQLHERTSWSERFSMIDRFLMEKFTQSQYEVRPEIYWAWQQLASKGGRLSIRDMAKTIGWSNRHFSQCFQQHIGITPKLAARQIRFYASLRRLRMSHEDSLSQIAIASGYADQSHFTREFHSFAGCSPKTYRKAHGAGLAGISGCLLNASQP
jgi:AraC-like DNA-binding protein